MKKNSKKIQIEWEKLSWTNFLSIPPERNSDSLKLSKKKPLSSENDFGWTSTTSGMFNCLNVNGINFSVLDVINIF